jgi:hypothetical protein
LFQHVPQIQFGATVLVGAVVFDTEADARRVVARCVFDGHLRLADEAEFPTVVVPDGSNLLDVLHGHVRSRLVLTEYEIRTMILQIETLAQAKFMMLGIVVDAVLLPRHGGTRVSVAVFAIAR